MDELAGSEPAPAPNEDWLDAIDADAVMAEALRGIVEDPDASTRGAAVLFQDFGVRCRMAGLRKPPLDLAGFTRRLAAARAGIFEGLDGEWAPALDAAHGLPDEMLGAFLLIARAARDGEASPSDEAIAHIYGTSSIGRARRVLSYMEERNSIVLRVDLSGRRSITIPSLGWTTAAVEA
jgi:hypothetical protein